MSSVEINGMDDVKSIMTTLARMLGPRATVTMELDERSRDILAAQADRGRNVNAMTAAEGEEIAAIAVKHVEAARDSKGRITGGDGEAMYREMGELARDIIADKIDDRRAANKADLSDDYKIVKQQRWGHVNPILNASGTLLAAVRSAPIKVER